MLVGDVSEVVPLAAPVNFALFEEPKFDYLLDVDLIVGEIHTVGDILHFQCFFQITVQDALSGFLKIRSHEVVQIDGLVDSVCLIFGEELHP